ncbi:MAG: hypothetical protein DMD57_10165 [Gemmatimonadetes bacterium]|nr:MAG: hypothetical protein DMD57_10165 [Gemmatimonadota bacterium]
MNLLPLFYMIAGWQSGATDSLAMLASARRARDSFEATRRTNLPERPSGSNGGRYEVIGRIRYWYDGGDDQDSAPPEPPRIRQARARLLAALDEAGAALPGDEWIAGQRVRYLLEDSQPHRAARVAEQCRAVRWWCEALGGLVRHVGGDFAGADSLFTVALADMPDNERCRWSDIAPLLDGELAGRYRQLDCPGRAAFENRWWWLAQPLYSLGRNDRRTEHFARQAMVRIEQGRRTTFGLFWENDLRDVLLRYGWPTWWTREPPKSPLVQSEPNITGHDPSPAFQFTPGARAFDDPGQTKSEDWSPDPPQGRERYAPGYAKAFAYPNHQVSVFRRGDSCVVVAAYDLSKDTLLADQPARAALVLTRSEHDAIVTDHETLLDRPHALVATAPCGRQLLSLEVVAPARRSVARARYGLSLDENARISDLLLLEGSDSLPTDLAGAVPHALATTRVRGDRPLGLFWEVHDLSSAGEEVTTSLTVTRRGSGWLRRAAQMIGLAAPRRDVSLEWAEVLVPRPDQAAVAGRALALDLSSLSPGPYRIEITVMARGRAAATVQRDIEVVRP